MNKKRPADDDTQIDRLVDLVRDRLEKKAFIQKIKTNNNNNNQSQSEHLAQFFKYTARNEA